MGKNFSGNTNKERPKSDFYQTPYSMTEQLLQNEEFIGNVLEPSCGKGAISKVLKDHNFDVTSQDYDEGLGIDFLKFNKKFDNIITNPPFRLANEFVKKSLELANNKIAMLLPLNYLHGVTRLNEIYNLKKLKTVYVFTRYPLLTQDLREDGKYKTGMMVYAWYIWDQKYYGYPEIRWINNNEYVLSSKI